MENETTMTCVRCKNTLPRMTKDGKHNFAPSLVDGVIVDVCMKCKMKEKPDSQKANKPRTGGWC